MIDILENLRYHTYIANIQFPNRKPVETTRVLDEWEQGHCWQLRQLYRPVYTYSALQEMFVDRPGTKPLPNDVIVHLYGRIDTSSNYGTLNVFYSDSIPPAPIVRLEFCKGRKIKPGACFASPTPLAPRRVISNSKGNWRLDAIHTNRAGNHVIRYRML